MIINDSHALRLQRALPRRVSRGLNPPLSPELLSSEGEHRGLQGDHQGRGSRGTCSPPSELAAPELDQGHPCRVLPAPRRDTVGGLSSVSLSLPPCLRPEAVPGQATLLRPQHAGTASCSPKRDGPRTNEVIDNELRQLSEQQRAEGNVKQNAYFLSLIKTTEVGAKGRRP